MITPSTKLPVIQRVFKSSYLVPRDFQTLPDFGLPLGTACFSLLCFITRHVGKVLQLELYSVLIIAQIDVVVEGAFQRTCRDFWGT